MTQVFVYGTLKKGCCNHHFMMGQRFVAEAATAPIYRMHNLGGYPGMVRVGEGGLSITGEIWEVDDAALAGLDELEGVAVGEYRRVLIPLAAPHDTWAVLGYEYLRPVDRAPILGSTWTEA